MDYYDVFPRIVPADKVSEVRIRPRYKHALFPEAELMQVVCNPFDGLNPDGMPMRKKESNGAWTATPL